MPSTLRFFVKEWDLNPHGLEEERNSFFFGGGHGGHGAEIVFPIFAKAQMALQLWSVAIFAHELGTSARR